LRPELSCAEDRGCDASEEGYVWGARQKPQTIRDTLVNDEPRERAERVQVLIGLLGCGDGFDCSLNDSTTAWVDNVRFGVYGTPTSEVPEVPDPPSAQLMAANPNPLSTTTRISYTTPADGHATLTVFDVAGRHVRTLVDAPLPAGPHEVTWNARDDAGQRVAAGLYFYRLTAGEYTTARKLVVAP
jgi:hypothetical protein